MEGLRLRLYGAVSWVRGEDIESALSKMPASIVLPADAELEALEVLI